MIRFMIVGLFAVIHSTLFCLMALALSCLDRDGRRIHAWCAAPWSRLILLVSGVRVKRRGLGNVDPSIPRIYMTNHQSYYDIFALLAYLPVQFKFIMKQELMRIPVLGQAMQRAGYIGIERKDPRKAFESLHEAVERIRQGASVLIFPEGTRSEDGRLQPFKRGGFSLALRSGCDIVPVAVTGGYEIFPRGSFKVRKGVMSLAVGRPIGVRGHTRRTLPRLMEEVREAMAGLMAEA